MALAAKVLGIERSVNSRFLEPGRPSVSWQKTIKALCNPT